jgi:hypothetical protein
VKRNILKKPKNMKKGINNILLMQLLFLSLAGITALQKITGTFVPEWFVKKFEPTLIGTVPYGIELAFLTIISLETLIAVCFLISIVRMEFVSQRSKSFLFWGFDLAMLLFLVLFFGSFLAGDYSNGALDFMYFGITYLFKRDLETRV